MTAKTTATRAEAIAAAADKFDPSGRLPFWDADSEIGNYVRGICEVLADTFGVNDPENARSEIWEEMRIAFDQSERRAEAKRIAARIADDYTDRYAADAYRGDELQMVRGVIEDAATAAALAGMEAAR